MRRHLQLLLWSGAGLLGLAAWLVFGAAGTGVPEGWTVCLARRTFGIGCAGCGLTRSIVQLLQGNVVEAFRLHPLGPLLTIEVGLGWVAWGAWLAGRLTPPPFAWVQVFLLGHVGLLLAVWVWRLATGTLPV